MCGSLFSTMGMPALNRSTHDAFNCELQWEKVYDRDELVEKVRTNVPLLNAEQKNVYHSLMKFVDDGTGGIYFLDAPGGTVKTFVRHFVDSGNNSVKISNCIGCCILWHCCHIVGRRSNCTFRFKAANESSHG